MATLFLDLSGSGVRVLVVEGQRTVDVRTLEESGKGADGIKALLAQTFAATGQDIDRAHLILPDADVSITPRKLQKMPLADAKKVLLRQDSAPGAAGASLQLTEIAGPQHQLHCLVESVSKETIASYRKAFAEEGVRLDTATSSLQSLLAAFAAVQKEIEHVEVIFNLSDSSVTALFLSGTEILSYERLELPEPERETTDESDPIRALKRRQFAVLTPLHSLYSHFMIENPELRVDKIWLCGPCFGVEGVAESLSEATDVTVALADHVADFDEGSCAFTALAGLMQVKDDPTRVNFIPAEMLKTFKVRPQVIMTVVSVALLFAIVILVVTMEKRVRRVQGELKKAQLELAALEVASLETKQLASSLSFLNNIEKNRAPFYKIFREIAETLPDELDLKDLLYQHDEEKNTLELIVIAEYGTIEESSDLFTDLTKVLDRSYYLSSYSDPVIKMLMSGDLKLIQISITCALSPAGGSDR